MFSCFCFVFLIWILTWHWEIQVIYQQKNFFAPLSEFNCKQTNNDNNNNNDSKNNSGFNV